MAAMEKLTVSGDSLVPVVKQLMREGNIKRICLLHRRECLIEVPLPLGGSGAPRGRLVAPVLAALAAFGALEPKCTIEIEKIEE